MARRRNFAVAARVNIIHIEKHAERLRVALLDKINQFRQQGRFAVALLFGENAIARERRMLFQTKRIVAVEIFHARAFRQIDQQIFHIAPQFFADEIRANDGRDGLHGEQVFDVEQRKNSGNHDA